MNGMYRCCTMFIEANVDMLDAFGADEIPCPNCGAVLTKVDGVYTWLSERQPEGWTWVAERQLDGEQD